MTRRGDLLRTDAVQRCLNAMMPAGISFHGKDIVPGLDSQAGTFLDEKDRIVSDSFWSEWDGQVRQLVRRRVTVYVDVAEDVMHIESP